MKRILIGVVFGCILLFGVIPVSHAKDTLAEKTAYIEGFDNYVFGCGVCK